jgi:acyl-CoA hydrolase
MKFTRDSEGSGRVAAEFFASLSLQPFSPSAVVVCCMHRTHVKTVTMIEMVFPDQTNHYGTLFGGHALRLMDKAAFVAAPRYARRTVVTACSERVDFKNAVHHGNLIELAAKVVATGHSSITVQVELFAEDLLSGERQLCAQGKFVLVALDGNGKPTAVPATPAETANKLKGNQ